MQPIIVPERPDLRSLDQIQTWLQTHLTEPRVNFGFGESKPGQYSVMIAWRDDRARAAVGFGDSLCQAWDVAIARVNLARALQGRPEV